MSVFQWSKERAELAIRLLSEAFQLKDPPSLIWTARSKNGRYSGRRKAIIIGHNCWAGVENILLHEFSHALSAARGNPVGHGDTFFTSLSEVVMVWFGHPAAYNWEGEYHRLKERARKLGWIPLRGPAHPNLRNNLISPLLRGHVETHHA